MKRIIASLAALLAVFTLKAQTPLAGAVSKLNAAHTAGEYQQLANEFQRLAGAAPDDWLPTYYAAVSNMRLAFLHKDKAMLFADQAEAQIKKAVALVTPAGNKKDLAEVYTVYSFINRARVEADPMSNGRKYGPVAGQQLAQARKADPGNPRALYLDGHIKYQTPAMWGGDKKKAKELFAEALKQFDVKPASDTAPQWGREDCEKAIRVD